jgi:GntR family transcriptional regulator
MYHRIKNTLAGLAVATAILGLSWSVGRPPTEITSPAGFQALGLDTQASTRPRWPASAPAACAARSPCPSSRSRRCFRAGRAEMSIAWSDNAPIYRQLKERVVGMMLDGVLKPGDALPSVRQIAAEYQLNPITVSRAYQELADEDLVEKRRGLGMYMTDGAREKLLASERERFLKEEWPAMVERINRLGLDIEKLLRASSGGAQ